MFPVAPKRIACHITPAVEEVEHPAVDADVAVAEVVGRIRLPEHHGDHGARGLCGAGWTLGLQCGRIGPRC